MDEQSVEAVVDWMRSWLRKHGAPYKLVKLPAPRRELAGSIRITDYDPETGELLNERFMQARDRYGRPQ